MGLKDLAACLEGLGQRGWGWWVSLGALPFPRYWAFSSYLHWPRRLSWTWTCCFPFNPVHRGWRPHAVVLPPTASCSCGESSLARLQDFSFLPLKHEGFSLQMQFLNNRLFWKPLSCRFKYFIFPQAQPMSLCSEKWARVSEVPRISVKACEQKLHVCSLRAGVQGRVYIFTFNWDTELCCSACLIVYLDWYAAKKDL